VLISRQEHSTLRRPGEHLKNAFAYQRDLDRFTPIVEGKLHPISVPSPGEPPVLDPISFRPRATIRSAQNPRQDADKTLPSAAVAYGVGGMFTHWTSNTPRLHPRLKRMQFISECEWDSLYERAERLLSTQTDIYADSVRHRLVKQALGDHYGDRLPPDRAVQALPVAGQRRTDNDEFVYFTGADTILGPLVDKAEAYRATFELLPEHRVTRWSARAAVSRARRSST
jgi:pyranose oxidase